MRRCASASARARSRSSAPPSCARVLSVKVPAHVFFSMKATSLISLTDTLSLSLSHTHTHYLFLPLHCALSLPPPCCGQGGGMRRCASASAQARDSAPAHLPPAHGYFLSRFFMSRLRASCISLTHSLTHTHTHYLSAPLFLALSADSLLHTRCSCCRFRAKKGQRKTCDGRVPERPESGRGCLMCAIFARLRYRCGRDGMAYG